MYLYVWWVEIIWLQVQPVYVVSKFTRSIHLAYDILLKKLFWFKLCAIDLELVDIHVVTESIITALPNFSPVVLLSWSLVNTDKRSQCCYAGKLQFWWVLSVTLYCLYVTAKGDTKVTQNHTERMNIRINPSYNLCIS